MYVPDVEYVKWYPWPRLLLLALFKSVLIPVTHSDIASVPEYMITLIFLVEDVLKLVVTVLGVFKAVLIVLVVVFKFADCEFCRVWAVLLGLSVADII